MSERFPTGKDAIVEWHWPHEVSRAIIVALEDSGVPKPFFSTGNVEQAMRPVLDEFVTALLVIKKWVETDEKLITMSPDARAAWELCSRVLRKWGVG